MRKFRFGEQFGTPSVIPRVILSEAAFSAAKSKNPFSYTEKHRNCNVFRGCGSFGSAGAPLRMTPLAVRCKRTDKSEFAGYASEAAGETKDTSGESNGIEDSNIRKPCV